MRRSPLFGEDFLIKRTTADAVALVQSLSGCSSMIIFSTSINGRHWERYPMLPPLSYILIPSVIAFFSGVAAALLTIFLNPRFQHYFWKRQKREELRLAVVKEVNRLSAEFRVHYLYKDQIEYTPEQSVTFSQAWVAVDGQVEDLFSESTYESFKRMQEYVGLVHVYRNQELMDRLPRLRDFDRIRKGALQALYREIGILKDESRWSQLKRRFKK
jgi:hypothetical protein